MEADQQGVSLTKLKEDQKLLKKQVDFQKEEEKMKKQVQNESIKTEMGK
jgi:hypothetical protein